MEIVCNKCGYKRNLGKSVQADEIFICTECQSKDVRLIDTGGVVIKVDGINVEFIQDTVVNFVKELASNISVYDIFNMLAKQGEVKEKDDRETK